jgi:hypothetical protein
MKEFKLKITFYKPRGKFNFTEELTINIEFTEDSIKKWIYQHYQTLSVTNNYTVEAETTGDNYEFIGFLVVNSYF